ncbi:MAG: PKD domain-containing protein [Acidobacteria bacterium]|nr:PKD domain-containing protein [Acidobacteriota bacterium]
MTFDPGDNSGLRNLGSVTNAQTIQHTYQSGGSYTARATVADSSGQRGETTAVVAVQRSPVTVSISANPTTVSTGEPVTFTINSSAGGFAGGTGPPIQSVRVTFPDGQSADVGPGQQTLVRSFTAPGTYTVRARATDTAGTSQESTTSVLVRERGAIEVNVTATSADSAPGLGSPCLPSDPSTFPKTCTFSSGFSGSARVQLSATVVGVSANDPVVRYVWNFGDGTQETSGRSTDHVFSRGTYTVTVTATTASGATGTGRVTLIIQ